MYHVHCYTVHRKCANCVHQTRAWTVIKNTFQMAIAISYIKHTMLSIVKLKLSALLCIYNDSLYSTNLNIGQFLQFGQIKIKTIWKIHVLIIFSFLRDMYFLIYIIIEGVCYGCSGVLYPWLGGAAAEHLPALPGTGLLLLVHTGVTTLAHLSQQVHQQLCTM